MPAERFTTSDGYTVEHWADGTCWVQAPDGARRPLAAWCAPVAYEWRTVHSNGYVVTGHADEHSARAYGGTAWTDGPDRGWRVERRWPGGEWEPVPTGAPGEGDVGRAQTGTPGPEVARWEGPLPVDTTGACGATVIRGHETFVCDLDAPHPGQNHETGEWLSGPDEGAVACPHCGGWLAHVDGCHGPSMTGGGHTYAIRWPEGGTPYLTRATDRRED